MHTDIPNDCEMFWKGYIEVPSKGPCGPGGCGPNGCGPNGCQAPGVESATYLNTPQGFRGQPQPNYETIPPGTQNPSAQVPQNRMATSMRNPPQRVASMRDTAPKSQPPTFNTTNRYNPSFPQQTTPTRETRPATSAPGFIGPVGYDVKN